MVRVLFLRAGNICRPPVSQGVFEKIGRREGLILDIRTRHLGDRA